MIGRIRPFDEGDLEGVVFRAEDEAECRAAGGESCADSIRSAYRQGQAVLVGLDPHTQVPFAYFGMGECDEVSGLVWMLGTDALAANARTIAKRTPAVLAAWHSRRTLLFNYVDARNALHIRWLRRLGFTFIKLHPRWGTQQLPFLEFARLPADV